MINLLDSKSALIECLAYVQQMEDVLAEAAEGFLRLKSKVSAFRAELQAEEEMSRNINDALPIRNGRQ